MASIATTAVAVRTRGTTTRTVTLFFFPLAIVAGPLDVVLRFGSPVIVRHGTVTFLVPVRFTTMALDLLVRLSTMLLLRLQRIADRFQHHP